MCAVKGEAVERDSKTEGQPAAAAAAVAVLRRPRDKSMERVDGPAGDGWGMGARL